MFIWFIGIMVLLFAGIMKIPSPILGTIILFGLCVWGLMAGPWWIVIISVLFLMGLAGMIFGD